MQRVMNKEELIEKLKKCEEDGDTESAHVEADDLLIEYINDPDIRKAYNDIGKWYS